VAVRVSFGGPAVPMKIGFRLNSLAVRLAGPVIIVCLVGGYALYATVQRNFSNFTERQVGQLMLSPCSRSAGGPDPQSKDHGCA
jgi:hypothetical protein